MTSDSALFQRQENNHRRHRPRLLSGFEREEEKNKNKTKQDEQSNLAPHRCEEARTAASKSSQEPAVLRCLAQTRPDFISKQTLTPSGQGAS